MSTEHQKLFMKTMTSLFQAQQSVTDLFFKNRLSEEIGRAIENYIKLQIHVSKETQHEYIQDLKNLVETIQEVTYLGKGEAVQLAFSHEQILRYLHSFLLEIRTTEQTSNEIKLHVESTEKASPSLISKESPIEIEKYVRARRKKELSKTQEKILDFVRRLPDRRTKDVVDEFSAISQRTVKRVLKELSEEGKIYKKKDRGAVYYSVD